MFWAVGLAGTLWVEQVVSLSVERRGRRWLGCGARPVARASVAERKLRVRAIAGLWLASASVAVGGNWRSVGTMPTTETIRDVRSRRGRRGEPSTGGTGGSAILSMSSATAWRRASASVSVVRRRCLQRWTHRQRIGAFLQGLTGWFLRLTGCLQRWTRGRLKSPFFQEVARSTGRRRGVCKERT